MRGLWWLSVSPSPIRSRAVASCDGKRPGTSSHCSALLPQGRSLGLCTPPVPSMPSTSASRTHVASRPLGAHVCWSSGRSGVSVCPSLRGASGQAGQADASCWQEDCHRDAFVLQRLSGAGVAGHGPEMLCDPWAGDVRWASWSQARPTGIVTGDAHLEGSNRGSGLPLSCSQKSS